MIKTEIFRHTALCHEKKNIIEKLNKEVNEYISENNINRINILEYRTDYEQEAGYISITVTITIWKENTLYD